MMILTGNKYPQAVLRMRFINNKNYINKQVKMHTGFGYNSTLVNPWGKREPIGNATSGLQFSPLNEEPSIAYYDNRFCRVLSYNFEKEIELTKVMSLKKF